ncbi:MAG: carbamoyl phosphate synthase large subunit, partial [Myxococcota bacterium]|nr:carbamoyl phosphate synthase large subunit [Myxococcota bacterium]
QGTVLVSVREEDRAAILQPIQYLVGEGFKVVATPGTAEALQACGIATEAVPKVGQGRSDVAERIEAGEADLVINTVGQDPVAVRDSVAIRRQALLRGIPYFTTVAGARAAVGAIRATRLRSIGVRALQDIHV